MSLVSFDGLIELPYLGSMPNTDANFLIDAVGEKAAGIFAAPKSGNIDRLGFRVGSVTAAETLKVSLQGVNTSGNPDGTIKGATNSAYATQATPAANTFYELTLNEVAAVTAPGLLALVVEFDSAIGNLNITGHNARTLRLNSYTDQFASAAWTKSSSWLRSSVRFDDGTYPLCNIFPTVTNGARTVNTGSNPDEVGNVLVLKIPVTAWGIRAVADFDGDCDAVLYDSTGTQLASASLLSSNRYNANLGYVDFMFSSPVNLAIGTYRVCLKPTTTTSITAYYMSVSAAAMMGHFDLGANCYETARVDGGSFVDNTANRYNVALLCGGMSNGVRAPQLRRAA